MNLKFYIFISMAFSYNISTASQKEEIVQQNDKCEICHRSKKTPIELDGKYKKICLKHNYKKHYNYAMSLKEKKEKAEELCKIFIWEKYKLFNYNRTNVSVILNHLLELSDYTNDFLKYWCLDDIIYNANHFIEKRAGKSIY